MDIMIIWKRSGLGLDDWDRNRGNRGVSTIAVFLLECCDALLHGQRSCHRGPVPLIVLKLLVVGVEVSESDALLVLSFLMSFVSEIELPNQLRVI